MKVLCVNNKYVELVITVGKLYETNELVTNLPDFQYLIKDDKNFWIAMDKEHFKTLDEVREDKLKELGL